MKTSKKRSNNRPAYLENTVSSKIMDSVIIIVLIILAISCILPIWYTFSISISGQSVVAAGEVFLFPKEITFFSYTEIMGDANFFISFWNSVQRVLLGTSISVVTICMMAYPLSKEKDVLPIRNVIMWILVFCMLFSGGLVPWFETMKALNLRNSILGLALAGGLPVFNVILVMNFYRNIPKEMEEAAVVDGAGPWTVLLRIVVPVSKPVIATIVLFVSVGQWNEFFHGLILSTKMTNYPLQTYIQQMIIDVNSTALTEEELKLLSTLSNQTLNAAKLFIALIPVVIVYPFIQKYFITGITLGSVKG